MERRRDVPLELLETLGDFTRKENWDKFFSLRGAGDSFEWYAEWPSLRGPLLRQIPSVPCAAAINSAVETPQILVPGCGNSRVSEHLYDAGFHQITNIDFSKVVVSDMLRRNVRSRPEMRWRVMDMTDMQFADQSFDIIFDKGGLDALMDPEVGSELGEKFLKEVKRVLKPGGKYVCLTLAETHVLGLLFTVFRFGWTVSIHVVPHKPGNKPTFQTFMVVSMKETSSFANLIEVAFDQSSSTCNLNQAQALVNGIERENQIREEFSSGADVIYSLRDIELGAQGNLCELQAGRRCQLILGDHGVSLYSYKTVLLDAKQKADLFHYNCGVFLVPKIRAREWLFASEEGQWQIVESSKAARLIMVFLDSSHSHAKMEAIQKDLSLLVKSLTPTGNAGEYQIPFMMANDGVKQRDIVHQVTSKTTGSMIIEDVVYVDTDTPGKEHTTSEGKIFRRLIFERSLGLVQSEALLTHDRRSNSAEKEKKQNSLNLKSGKKGSRKRIDSSRSFDGSKHIVKIDHKSLVSFYHRGILFGFSLVSSELEIAVSSQVKVKVIVIGLGAGLFPMFLRTCLPFLDIEVVELDPVVLDIARDYFGFNEDSHLKVHIGDGIKFIQKASVAGSSELNVKHRGDSSNDTEGDWSIASRKNNVPLSILIVDADSSDLSSGLACPPADFVEESFVTSVKNLISPGGLFVLNLVSRSPTIKQTVISRLKAAFNHLFSLELEEDVNEVLFASMEICFREDEIAKGVDQLQKLLNITMPDLQSQAGEIRRLK
ncbi:hypothetical protein AXF42_Ash020243 [Apostasia shenzhenica]|uniref:Methyltransferase type 11 domain-containing protein n=1 Tax=Apostasia shenzhenica TaxID=1088818 RepID=A0A2I0AVR9_9ASPA|nr:hypothetical protein AXF42_Ash020243 [Apostasia shenzhenica]